jgi:hypothetical protein
VNDVPSPLGQLLELRADRLLAVGTHPPCALVRLHIESACHAGPNRLLPNGWTSGWEQSGVDPLPMPLQPVLTVSMRGITRLFEANGAEWAVPPKQQVAPT